MTKAERFFYDIKDKKLAFIGLGVSHNDLIRLCRKKGIDVTVLDRKSAEQLGDIYGEFTHLGVKFKLGEDYLDHLEEADIVFRSPGVYYNNPALFRARKNGVVITSEMEVFFDLCPCKIYAVTGTDGKTTTTSIITELLQAEDKIVYKGGNIGRALLPIIEQIKETDCAVVELSSFQLISMRSSPDVAVVTNIYPDHLNVHSSMEEYIDAKKNVLLHQNAFSKTVLNLDNELTNNLASDVRGELYRFSRHTVPKRGTFLDDEGWLCFTDGKEVYRAVHKDDIQIPGMHNVENYLAAIAAVWGEVSVENIVKVAREFGGVEHRIEFVREIDGVKYYNDSIATSPASVIAGLNAFTKKLIVIAGGSDKKLDYTTLAGPICDRVKVLVLIGETADKIEAAVTGCPDYDPGKLKIIRRSSLEDAVNAARAEAEKGDIITLSPASASFDMYKNFEERGHHFKRIVNAL